MAEVAAASDPVPIAGPSDERTPLIYTTAEIVAVSDPVPISGSSDERTPLIQVVTVQPKRRRRTGAKLRNFCTIVLSTTLVVLLFLFLLPFEWAPSYHHHRGESSPKWPWTNVTNHKSTNTIKFKELQKILLESPDPAKAEEWSKFVQFIGWTKN